MTLPEVKELSREELQTEREVFLNCREDLITGLCLILF